LQLVHEKPKNPAKEKGERDIPDTAIEPFTHDIPYLYQVYTSMTLEALTKDIRYSLEPTFRGLEP
jgi:hypothetical protein